MASDSNNRVYGLDILKAICAFFIIVIHANFPGIVGYYAIAISRIAVPIFFMITGYFYVNTQARNKQLDSIKKIFSLTLVSTSIYFFYICIRSILIGEGIEKIISLFSPKRILNWMLFNDVPFGSHLWYLYALLYCLLIVYLLEKYMHHHAYKILMTITPILLLADLAFGKYSLVLFHREFSYIYVRNFLCVGIPYFSIGRFLRRNEILVGKIRNNIILEIILIFVFSITTFIEKGLLDYFELGTTREHYISTTLLSVFVFIFFTSSFWEGKLSIAKHIGECLSLYIYIIHPIIIFFLGVCIRRLPSVIQEVYSLIMPIIIYCFSVFISEVILQIRKR